MNLIQTGKSRYGRVRKQAIPKQLQQEQAAIWSQAKKQKAQADERSEAKETSSVDKSDDGQKMDVDGATTSILRNLRR